MNYTNLILQYEIRGFVVDPFIFLLKVYVFVQTRPT